MRGIKIFGVRQV